MLFRHGSQSDDLISADLWKTSNRRENNLRKRKPKDLNDFNYSKRALCKSSRLIICFILTIMSHFKEEARKDMMKSERTAQSMQNIQ